MFSKVFNYRVGEIAHWIEDLNLNPVFRIKVEYSSADF